MAAGRIAVLIPAAGAARRMAGRDKLLEPVGGAPLLRRQAQAAVQAGAPVVVTLPDGAGGAPRRAALEGLPVVSVPVPDADEGMAASLRRGVAVLPRDAAAVLILPADMPDLDAEALRRVVAAFDPAAPGLVQGTAADGTPGHPVLFPADCFAALMGLRGDTGARSVLQAQAARVTRVALPCRAALTDLDTLADWAAWRAAHPDL